MLKEDFVKLDGKPLAVVILAVFFGIPSVSARAGGYLAQAPPVVPVDAKPFTCPAAGAAIDLGEGTWSLAGECKTTGLKLHGTAQLWMEGKSLSVDGNINLDDNAELHVIGGIFTVANHIVFEHHLDVTGHALIELRDMEFSTNAGVAGNLSTSYHGAGDSRLLIDNVKIDQLKSWLLCNLSERGQLVTKNSPNFPNEIYPHENSTVRIEGPKSEHRVWFFFVPGSSGELENLPSSHPMSFSFGRNTPGVTGIGYQVDVVNGNADFGVQSFPNSKAIVKNVFGNLGLDYEFHDVTTAEGLTGLKGGRQSGTYHNQGRVLEFENVDLPPYGWQVYSNNEKTKLEDVAPITITDSLINEMGAFKQGRFEVSHVQFAFAVIAAIGPSSQIHIRDSVINSQTIMTDSDGVVKIEDSEIYGALAQAVGKSRILLLNDTFRPNEQNPKCFPILPTMPGSLPNACNPYNPARDVQFVARAQGTVVVAGIDPISTPIHAGEKHVFVGDAVVEMSADASFTYNLRYGLKSDSRFKGIVSGAAGPKRGQPLGELDTSGLAPGDYVVQLQIIVPGQDPVIVQRPFAVAAH